MLKSVIKTENSLKQEIMPGRYINAPLPSDKFDHSQTSPFVLLHHFGPLEVNYLNRFAFEPHPHRGFEAVTILFKGEIQHRDSTGGKGSLFSGDVQWMTAGSGIVHEESQPEEFLKKGGIIHGIQLWINLPKKHKMTLPGYQDIGSNDIPIIGNEGAIERVIAGEFKGAKGPAKTYSPIIVVHGIIRKGVTIESEIPEYYNSLIYVTLGNLDIAGTAVSAGTLVHLSTGVNKIGLTASEDSEYLLLSGKPLDEPVVQYGPFVMSTMVEIKQAYLDYREGKFGKLEELAL